MVNSPIRYTIRLISGLLLVLFIGYKLGSWLGAFFAVACVLAVVLAIHLYHLSKLFQWLRHPKLRLMPRGFGLWDEVFNILLAQAKSRKKRKQKLGAALQRFNHVAESIPNGMLILNKDGRIEWMNHLVAQHLHLDPIRDRNGLLKNLIRDPDFHHFLSQPITQEIQQIKLKIHHDNQVRILSVMRTFFENHADLIITEDITTMEQVATSRHAFVANVSHELRTPLTVINGFLETLAEFPDLPDSQRTEFITLMRQEGDRMHMLLNDLLTLSHLESGIRQSQEKEEINLSSLVFQVAQSAQVLSNNQHQFTISIGDDIFMHGYYQDLYSAFSNLTNNAVRYTPASGHIQIILKRIGLCQAEFSVIDDGVGIAPEHIPHLTERFYRVDAGRSRKKGGTGLGLAIVKHALAEHDTHLNIASQVGEGSVFSVVLAVLPIPDEM